MLKSVSLIFIAGCAVLVHESTSLPYKDIFTNDAYPKINNEPNCLQSKSTFCVKLASYPEDKIKKILTPDFDKYFQQYPNKISDRNQNDNVLTNEMCPTFPDIIKPVAGITVNNITMPIINIGLNYTQEIRIEECMESAICSNVNAKNNYVSYCKQKYIYQRLLSVDADFKKVSVQLFKIPFGCCCAARQIL